MVERFVSLGRGTIACMFERVDDADLVSAIEDATRVEDAAGANRLAAIRVGPPSHR